jgi:hypothetical protein
VLQTLRAIRSFGRSQTAPTGDSTRSRLPVGAVCDRPKPRMARSVPNSDAKKGTASNCTRRAQSLTVPFLNPFSYFGLLNFAASMATFVLMSLIFAV